MVGATDVLTWFRSSPFIAVHRMQRCNAMGAAHSPLQLAMHWEQRSAVGGAGCQPQGCCVAQRGSLQSSGVPWHRSARCNVAELYIMSLRVACRPLCYRCGDLGENHNGNCDALVPLRTRAVAVKRSSSMLFGTPVTRRCDPFAIVSLRWNCLPRRERSVCDPSSAVFSRVLASPDLCARAPVGHCFLREITAEVRRSYRRVRDPRSQRCNACTVDRCGATASRQPSLQQSVPRRICNAVDRCRFHQHVAAAHWISWPG